VQALAHIAVHAGLVLQALSSSVHREVQVAGVKHDLEAPACMCRDAAAAALSPIESLKRLSSRLALSGDLQIAYESVLETLSYQVKDINAAAFLVLQLLHELNSDPLERIRLRKEPTFIAGSIIAGIKSTLYHYAREVGGISIEFGDFSSIPALIIDKREISRALSNLIINAIKYGEKGSTVHVNAVRSRERKAVMVSVMNYGTGVAEEDKDRIFLGNYRTKDAEETAQGEGWGLKIAQRIMRLHGGDLEITQLKNPTIFSLVFPVSLISKEN
jgi:signal transduction histidine kinase